MPKFPPAPFVLPPGWQLVSMDQCRPGMPILVLKSEDVPDKTEVWYGEVKSVSKPNRWVLLAHIPTYSLAGRTRDRWKPKNVKFANSAQYKVYYDTTRWTEAARKQRERREAYKNARQLFSAARTAMEEYFALLHMSPTISYDDFRAARKVLMRQYHADVVAQRIKAAPHLAISLQAEAARYTEALARVDHYIKARDGQTASQLSPSTNQ
jgi:hypothetical protein